MTKLIVKPSVFKERFHYEGKTYYLTLANKCLVSYDRVDTYLPVFHSQNNFCQLISKKEYKEIKRKYENSFTSKVKKHIQLTLF